MVTAMAAKKASVKSDGIAVDCLLMTDPLSPAPQPALHSHNYAYLPDFTFEIPPAFAPFTQPFVDHS
jgi:hypothetical protein